MNDLTDRLNEIAARWEHGHDELTDGCALCHSEWAEVYALSTGSRRDRDLGCPRLTDPRAGTRLRGAAGARRQLAGALIGPPGTP